MELYEFSPENSFADFDNLFEEAGSENRESLLPGELEFSDIPFTSNFSLFFKRNDYLHALVSFFTVEFSHCHKRVGFSTSPDHQYTHWKQTVFYLDDYITSKKGEEVTGVFTMKPNDRNVRDMDFEISINFEGELCSVKESNKYKMR